MRRLPEKNATSNNIIAQRTKKGACFKRERPYFCLQPLEMQSPQDLPLEKNDPFCAHDLPVLKKILALTT
jgi:hypothetical protein